MRYLMKHKKTKSNENNVLFLEKDILWLKSISPSSVVYFFKLCHYKLLNSLTIVQAFVLICCANISIVHCQLFADDLWKGGTFMNVKLFMQDN